MINESFDDVIESCRKSQYDEVADVLEYYADHETNELGPVYHPMHAPHRDHVDSYHVLWAFRAGRLLGAPDAATGDMAEYDRLVEAATEKWGDDDWSIETREYTDGDSHVKAFSTTDHVSDGIVIRETLTPCGEGLRYTRSLIDCTEIIETIEMATVDTVDDL